MFPPTRFSLSISVSCLFRIEVMSSFGRRRSRNVALTTSSASVTSAASLNDDDRARVGAVSRKVDPGRRVICEEVSRGKIFGSAASKMAGRYGPSEVAEIDRIRKEALIFVHLKILISILSFKRNSDITHNYEEMWKR